ncbi:hypothetical protein ACQKWADRAFT_280687 [Trichoderma austrokoningii]
MSCSCRIAPWRTFARGLAQIHRPEASPAAQLQWPAHRRVTAFGQNRGLHASKLHRQVDSPSQGADTVEGVSTTALDETDAAKQPAEKTQTRVKKDRHRDRRVVITAGERDNSYDTTSAAARRERKAVPTTPTDSPSSADSNSPDPSSILRRRNQEPWQLQKAALKEKFPEGWQPRKRLSPDALEGIRALNAQFPETYTTEALAEKFQVSSEAIRRILKSHWRPSSLEEEDRQQRWFRRGKQVWEQKAALGIKPPQRWRAEGIAREPGYHEWSRKASQREREWEEEENRKYRAYLDKKKRKKSEFTKGW